MPWRLSGDEGDHVRVRVIAHLDHGLEFDQRRVEMLCEQILCLLQMSLKVEVGQTFDYDHHHIRCNRALLDALLGGGQLVHRFVKLNWRLLLAVVQLEVRVAEQLLGLLDLEETASTSNQHEIGVLLFPQIVHVDRRIERLEFVVDVLVLVCRPQQDLQCIPSAGAGFLLDYRVVRPDDTGLKLKLSIVKIVIALNWLFLANVGRDRLVERIGHDRHIAALLGDRHSGQCGGQCGGRCGLRRLTSAGVRCVQAGRQSGAQNV